MSSISASGFKWLDLLEKEFDKSFVAIDQSARNVAEEYELEEVYDGQRRILSNLGNCFVQLVHKSQAIFQINAKYEAELVNYREELAASRKNLAKMEADKAYLLCILQSVLLENSLLKSEDKDQEKLAEKIQLKLANDLVSLHKGQESKNGFEDKAGLFESENARLRRKMADLESELVGARLDAKYLDKELAGRIQQIQILLASNASQDHKQQVWAQIEAEMHLQRSKTIANMCYSKQKLRDQQLNRIVNTEQTVDVLETSCSNRSKNRLKQVHLHKHDSDELGMAILGGVEHGLPIIISEVFPNSSVGRNKKIYAGDVILGVNGDSFTEMGHHEAVKYLSALRGSIRFDLENAIEADIDEVCDMDAQFYQLDIDSDTHDKNKPPPPQRLTLSHPGKAKDLRSSASTSANSSPSKTPKELPAVHAKSPAKIVIQKEEET